METSVEIKQKELIEKYEFLLQIYKDWIRDIYDLRHEVPLKGLTDAIAEYETRIELCKTELDQLMNINN